MSIGSYGIFHDEICLYVGQSVNVEKRLKSHMSSIRSKTHSRTDLLEWMTINRVEFEDLSFKVLETIEIRDQFKLNELEVFYYLEKNPLFSGQSPSVRNDYTTLSNNPEVSRVIGDRIAELISESSTGVFRIEGGRRLWGRSCINCFKIYESYSPTGFYCSTNCKSEFKDFKKTCEICETEFKAKYRKTKFCHDCKYKVHSYTLNCLICETEFISGLSNAKYCNLKCNVESQKVSRICGSCGEEYFGVQPGRCTTCRENKLWGCICSDCGAEFQGSGPMSKFCSEPCGVNRVCSYCTSNFKTRGKAITCSDRCSKALKSPSASKTSKIEIEELRLSGLTPKETIKQLGISKSVYYRILKS